MTEQEFKNMIVALDKQNNEFDAGRRFAERLRVCLDTPVVDDDYPRVRHEYEGALKDLLSAIARNRDDTAPKVTMGLSFCTLRAANLKRLPLFKNARGETAHAKPDGSDWSLADWFVATMGELGEAANFAKKIRRGDFVGLDLENAKRELAHELADVAIYLDILSMQCGVDLGAAIADKWNITSEKIGVPLRIDYAGDIWIDIEKG